MKMFVTASLAGLLMGTSAVQAGYTDSLHVTPDWRGDGAAVHVGWDVLSAESFPPAIGVNGGVMLDDTTPDIGDTGISGARLQQVTDVFGHISSTGNYYSGFAPGWGANDVITAPTDATSHGTGFTTVIFQMTGQDLGLAPVDAGDDPQALADEFGRLDLTLNGVAASEANFARGVNANGVSQWFAQWEIAGDPVSVQIAFSNSQAHTALDFFEVDVLWSEQGGQLVQTPTIVPEPTTAGLLGLACVYMLRRRRDFERE